MSANERSPTHYIGKYQHWDLAIAIPMSYLAGCSTKYVCRWRQKDGLKDLSKALHYLDKMIETYIPVPIPRTMTRSEIQYEVSQFAHANKLSIIEEEYLFKLASYRYENDLIEARLVLEDIIDLAKKEEETRNVAEPNHPGTPDDGGHHAVQIVENE
jgi:Protein of unknwon function (DUF3310)